MREKENPDIDEAMRAAERRIKDAATKGASYLYLSGLNLVALPQSLSLLSSLRTLDVSQNFLTSLPDWLCQLRNLRKLDASNNRLATLPEPLGRLCELESLNLSRNALALLPDSIGALQKLTYLDVSDNYLVALPKPIQRLKQLDSLQLHGNRSLGIPEELWGGSIGAIVKSSVLAPVSLLDYYFYTKNGSRPLNEAKLILVGRGGVGKTSLVNRLLNGGFNPKEHKTHGIGITGWLLNLGKEKVRLNVWDFGGQEIMHATHQFFLTRRSLYLLVLNAREGEQDTNVEYWLKIISSFGAESPVIVVINKIKDHTFDLNRRGLRQKYPAIRDFIQTDCEEGTGLGDLRGIIERETDRLENLRDPFPEAWFKVKDELARMDQNYMSFDQYREFCRRRGVDKMQSQESLVSVLHQLGIVLNFREDARLCDLNVLKPEWVTKGIYKLLNAETLAKKDGVMVLSDLSALLNSKEYPSETYSYLIDLMKKFELCFEFEGSKGTRYLVPELLGKEEPALADWQSGDVLRFQYHYNILPEGLLPRFIVITHAMSEGRYRWRTGVVIAFEANEALVKADVQDRRVYITIRGETEGRRRLLAVIRAQFDHIHQSIPKLEAIEKVPVPGESNVTIPYRKLVSLEDRAIDEYEPENMDRPVSVQKLLNGMESLQSRTERRGRDQSCVEKHSSHAVQLFYSYSHKDEQLRDELEKHLSLLRRQGVIREWHDRRIAGGFEWKGQIDSFLNSAGVILLLVSSDFLASDYCYDAEMKRALERHEKGEAVVIPIILRAVDWQSAPFGKLQGYPKDMKPVTSWANQDEAFADISKGIRATVESRADPF